MNSDSPHVPREELEARLTALLLGELSAEEAAAVHRALEQDAELARLHERLKRTIDLVREAAASPIEQAAAQPAPLRLSEERRQRLLQRFKTVAPRELASASRREMPWFVPMSIAAALVAMIGSVALLPGFGGWSQRAKSHARRAPFPQGVANNLNDAERGEDSSPANARNRLQFAGRSGSARQSVEERADTRRSEPGIPAYPALLTAKNADGVAVPQKQSESEVTLRTEVSGGQSASLTFSGIALPSVGDLVHAPEGAARSATPGTRPALNFSDSISRLQERNVTFSADVNGTPSLGGTPVLGTLFQTADADEKTVLGAQNNSPIAVRQPTTSQIATDSLPGAWAAGPQTADGDRKIGVQGGTAPSSSAVAGYALTPLPPVSLKNDTDQPRESGIVAFSINGTSLESLAGGLAVPSSEGQRVSQPGKPESENWVFRTPAFAKAPSLEEERKLSRVDMPELRKSTDAGANSHVLANRGEQDSAAPKMEPQLMSRYGLMRPGSALSPSSAVAAPRQERSIRQPIVLPQTQPESIADRPLRLAQVTPAAQPTFALQEKKRELDELVQLRDNISLRANSEKIDATIPKNGLVEIVDAAEVEPEKNPGLVERLRRSVTGGVEKVARIEVGKDATDIAPILIGVKNPTTYDPYFIQTEPEKIRSKYVLHKVIEKLNLNEAWARKNGTGEKLKTEETFPLLLNRVDVRSVPNTSQIEIRVNSDKPEEAARIANTIAEVYRDSREERSKQASERSARVLQEQLAEQEKKVVRAQEELEQLQRGSTSQPTDVSPPKPVASGPVPQADVQTHDNAFSTFSLNVSDVSFKLAAASLEKAVMPEPATVRSEEFINAFDYRDSEPPPGVPIVFAWERARYPFAHNRDLLRFSVKTAAQGRQAGRSLNLVLLLDNSGSMERADRARIVREALRTLAGQLQPQDKLSVIAFSRTARLWADGVAGHQAGQVAEQVSNLSPQGGTNLEDAMNLAYQTALKHYAQGGVNRVVLLTDGAANLGNVNPDTLKQKVETHRKQGIALDCFGIGWEGYNDDLLEVLSRNGDGRYGFINTPEEASTGFAGQLAGALRVAASDVKVQVEFNPKRVTAYRQIGYGKHQLTQEQFRDNTVDAAEIGAAESGNALYVVELNPRGEGLMAVVRVRYKVPGTVEYHEHEWIVPYTGNAVALEQASSALRLAATASAFSEWLASSPYAAEVTPDRLLAYLGGVPDIYGIDPKPKKLEWMIRQAKSLAGR